MTTGKHRKRLARARMARTGESYQSAERVVSRAGSPGPDDAARLRAVIAGRYRLTEVVPPPPATLSGAPEDAPWVLYSAEHALLGGDLDIKLLPRGSGENYRHLRMWLLREGRAMQRGAHPRVVKVYDIGETDEGEVYLVLERVSRATLATHLEAQRVDEAFAREVVRQLAELLDHLHRKGVVHRGIRNGAIHLDAPGESPSVKLSSFSLADIAGEPRLAPAGAVFGHPAWMSPEQCRGEEVDGRTDLYALGIVLYTMLAHAQPFWHSDRSRLLELQRSAPPPPLRRPGAPPSPLDAICTKLLAKDRAERFADAAELLQALP